jgi:ribosomal protein S18 acetylase RimI-like enzyme
MTSAEYAEWVPKSTADYAAEHAAAGSMPADKAQELAEKQFAELLPEGLHTARHHLLLGTQDGERVGILWLEIPPPGEGPAFVYDIEVDADKRGRGYGRAIMLAAETYCRDHGATVLRLHVFGSNSVARSLYDSLGFETTNVMMSKTLAG